MLKLLHFLPNKKWGATRPEIGQRSHRSSFDPVALRDAVVLQFRAFIRLIPLLHKDPEFEAITELDQSWLA